MRVKLKDIVELQPGVYLKPLEGNSKSVAHLLGLRDFDENLDYLNSSTEVDKKEVKEKYIINGNDILFSSRMQFNAFYLPKDKSKTFVASSSFIILKPNLKKVVPDYLMWFLNHPNTQHTFSSLSQATSRVPYISTKKLQEIELDLPNLSTQKQIADIHQLQRREKQLTHALLEKKEQYIQHILLNTSKQ